MKNQKIIDLLYQQHTDIPPGIHINEVGNFVDRLMKILFPVLCDKRYVNKAAFASDYYTCQSQLESMLRLVEPTEPKAQEKVSYFFEHLLILLQQINEDAEAILKGDPAAIDKVEVIRTYPGHYAIAIYRIAHFLYRMKIAYLPRMLTEYAHTKTSIDIHPAAQIGAEFCIDHGTGVVIGETVEIGRMVKLYQGVTLGALSVTKDMAKIKRHPTIEDNVIIYANATILGGDTIVGARSVIGGNVWLTRSIAPDSKIYYKASNISHAH